MSFNVAFKRCARASRLRALVRASSYDHTRKAGNFGDIVKHAVLAELLQQVRLDDVDGRFQVIRTPDCRIFNLTLVLDSCNFTNVVGADYDLYTMN